MELAIAPQLVGNNGLQALRAAIAAPERYAWRLAHDDWLCNAQG